MDNQNNLNDPLNQLDNTADFTAQMDPKDIEDNKVMGVLAYLGILVLVPIFGKKDSPFAQFHANQGLLLFLGSIALVIVINILNFVVLSISDSLFFVSFILNALYLAPTVLAILGIVNAASGKAKELPFIGKFRLIK